MDRPQADPRAGKRLGPREQALVTSALPLVDLLARRVGRRFPTVPAADLRSAGHEAVVLAALTYDPTLGVPFRTFAWKRIMGALVHDAPNEAFGTLHQRIRLAFAADTSEPPGELTLEEALLDTPEAARARALAWVRKQAAGMILAALFEAGQTAGGEDDVVARETQVRAREALDRALAALTDDERYFVERHYRDGATFDVLAVELAVVPRTVVRLHEAVKTKLAKALRREGIENEPPIGEEEEE